MTSMTARGVGLLIGYAADRLLGDPRRLHPVAGFGRMASILERGIYADNRLRGIVLVGVMVGGPAALAGVIERRIRNPIGSTLLVGAATWAVLGGRSLEREAAAVHQLLSDGDTAGARHRLRNLVGRDTGSLTTDEIARAAIESVAENTGDAVVASLVWGAVAGLPGLIAHRAANTLDAMIGHHNGRYEHFGWAAARLDDAIGLPGSRLSALITVIIGPDHRGAVNAWRRDARRHPSPNAGVIESTFAGALGLQLGGTNTYYGNRIEHRALMGSGRHPTVADVPRATQLAFRVGMASAATAAGVSFLRATTQPLRRRP